MDVGASLVQLAMIVTFPSSAPASSSAPRASTMLLRIHHHSGQTAPSLAVKLVAGRVSPARAVCGVR